MAEVTPPLFLDVDSFYGADELGLPYRDLIGEGVIGYEELRVRQRAAGANMSVDVGAGICWVMGDNSEQQPRYRCFNDSVKNLAVPAADPTNPRLDLVIAEVRDATFAGSFNDWRLRVVAGVPTAGANLDNRSGAAAVPNNSILLADVLVAAADTSIVDADIRDRRPFGNPGVIPPLLTDVDMVAFEPAAPLPVTRNAVIDHVSHDGFQVAALMFLPRRIVGATRIRWKYAQGPTALTGNYLLGIYDASGRHKTDTGSVAFTGAANTHQQRSEVITATTFDAGWHYVFLGLNTTAGAGQTLGVPIELAAGSLVSAAVPNVGLGINLGGVVAPITLLALLDFAAISGAAFYPPIPLVALSVG